MITDVEFDVFKTEQLVAEGEADFKRELQPTHFWFDDASYSRWQGDSGEEDTPIDMNAWRAANALVDAQKVVVPLEEGEIPF